MLHFYISLAIEKWIRYIENNITQDRRKRIWEAFFHAPAAADGIPIRIRAGIITRKKGCSE